MIHIRLLLLKRLRTYNNLKISQFYMSKGRVFYSYQLITTMVEWFPFLVSSKFWYNSSTSDGSARYFSIVNCSLERTDQALQIFNVTDPFQEKWTYVVRAISIYILLSCEQRVYIHIIMTRPQTTSQFQLIFPIVEISPFRHKKTDALIARIFRSYRIEKMFFHFIFLLFDFIKQNSTFNSTENKNLETLIISIGQFHKFRIMFNQIALRLRERKIAEEKS